MKISKLANNTDCEVIEFDSMETLAQMITLTNWAPGIFENNYRNLNNFKSADIIALDVDDGCTLEDARKLFAGYTHIIATTRNHQKEKNGITGDRFRVILLLESPILNPRVYRATYLSLGVHFPFVDLACADAARQFYQSLSIVSIQSHGKLIQPVEKGAVAKLTVDFLVNGAEKGKWNPALFKAAKDLQQQGYVIEETVELLKRPTGYLDKKDMGTIESAYNKDPRHPARVDDDGVLKVYKWVGEWILEKKLDINYNEEIVLNGKGMNYGQIEDRLLLDTAEKGHKFQDRLLFAALRVYYDNALDKILDTIKAKIAFDPAITQNIIGEYVKALEGKENPLTEAVMRHFVWQVKRKLNGLRVDHHLMPILVGPTNGGKSRAVTELVKPLFTLVIEKQLNIVNDERQLFNFSKYFIVVFDEMSNSAKTDVDCLKNIITSDRINYRMMGKNKNSTNQNSATFIGSSNNDVKFIINDPTSARRFYQVDCQKRLPWDVVNGIDYLALWKSVDEKGPAPIKPFLSELGDKQETFRQLSLIEEWLELTCTVSEETWTKGEDALREFNAWIKDHNLKGTYRPQRFLAELSKHVPKKRIDNQRFYGLIIKPAFTPPN